MLQYPLHKHTSNWRAMSKESLQTELIKLHKEATDRHVKAMLHYNSDSVWYAEGTMDTLEKVYEMLFNKKLAG